MSNFRLFFLFLFLVVFQVLQSQELKFDNLTTRDGLLSDDIYNLHQDRKGYIWLFTNYGAMKYNGSTFQPVLVNLRFEEAFIYSIYENEKGEKWVANSQSRIFRVRNDSAFVVPGTDSVSAHLRDYVNEIYQLHVDDSLNIYAITKQKCFKFINKGGRYEPRLMNKLFAPGDSLTFMVLKKGPSFLPIYRFQSEEAGILSRRQSIAYLAIADDNGTIRYRIPMNGVVKLFRRIGEDSYLTAYNSVLHFRGKSLVKIHAFAGVVTNISLNSDSSLWVGVHNGGLVKIDKRDSVAAHYFPGVTVNYALFDSQMGIWVSTSGQGLYHCVDKEQASYGASHPLGKNISMLKIKGDSLYIGTTGALYAAVDRAPSLLYKHPASYDLMEMETLEDGFLLSFRDQLLTFDRKKGPASSRSLYPEASTAFRVLYASSDSVFFVHRKGLLIAGNNKLIKRIDLGLKTYDAVVKHDHLLLATEDGIFRVDFPLPAVPSTAKAPLLNMSPSRPDHLQFTGNMLVTRIVEGPPGVTWFCTTGSGLIEMNGGGRVSHFTTADGLPSNFINHITSTPTGLILLSTNKGHYVGQRSPGESLRSVKWNKTYDGHVNCSQVFRGRLYIGSRSGLVIRASFADRPGKTFYFNLTGIRVHEEPVAEERLVDLTYKDNDLEFNYDFIDFTREQADLYFLLKGKYSDSGIVKGNTIRLQNLHPGRYNLYTYPLVTDGRKLVIRTKFVLRPALWQRSWFIALLIFFAALLVAGIALYAFKFYKRRQEKRAEAERLILEYKLIAIKAQVNPHFVSNCLTAIQHLIINNRVEAATKYIAKFGFLVRQILNFSTRSLVTLAEELEITLLNIELEQLRFDQKFRFELEVLQTLDPSRLFVPSLIINPLVENAIWHGLLPLRKEREATLLIRVLEVDGRLWLQVEDNGVGRKKVPTELGNNRDSKGLALTEQRLANINYLYGRNDSELRFSDLTDERGFPIGTRVTIVLPMNLQPLKNG